MDDKDKINKLIGNFKNNELFIGIEEEELKRIAQNIKYTMKYYDKDQVIAFEEEKCDSLGLILDGVIEIQRLYSNGKHIVLNRFGSGGVFGEAVMFTKVSEYPATVVAVTECIIAYIKREDLIKVCSDNERVLENFITLLSDKIFILNKKIKTISFKTVRQKVINFILESKKKQKSNVIKLTCSKEEIANNIGIPRPSLSRELIKLRDDELIEFDRNTITILDFECLEDELIE